MLRLTAFFCQNSLPGSSSSSSAFSSGTSPADDVFFGGAPSTDSMAMACPMESGPRGICRTAGPDLARPARRVAGKSYSRRDTNLCEETDDWEGDLKRKNGSV